MPRLMGVDVPGNKRIEYALRYIHGIGPKRAMDIVEACNIEIGKKADALTPDEIRQVVTYIQENYRVEGDLRREVSGRGLPCRGQRTKTNARTRKGAKKTVSTVREK